MLAVALCWAKAFGTKATRIAMASESRRILLQIKIITPLKTS
jgi:hypothetical protein